MHGWNEVTARYESKCSLCMGLITRGDQQLLRRMGRKPAFHVCTYCAQAVRLGDWLTSLVIRVVYARETFQRTLLLVQDGQFDQGSCPKTRLSAEHLSEEVQNL